MSRATGKVHRQNGTAKPEVFRAARIPLCTLFCHSLSDWCCSSSLGKFKINHFERKEPAGFTLMALPAQTTSYSAFSS